VNISGLTVMEANATPPEDPWTAPEPYAGIYVQGNYCRILGNKAMDNWVGIKLSYSSGNEIVNNIIANTFDDIHLDHSINNTITNNTVSKAIHLSASDNNRIENNNGAVELWGSKSNVLKNNTFLSIHFWVSDSNILTKNSISEIIFLDCGYTAPPCETCSSNNLIYLNNLTSNNSIKHPCSHNLWNSTEEIAYTYNGKTCTSYLGNYWSDYTGSDTDGDGIGDTPYSIDSDADNYPLVQPFENYEIAAPTNNAPTASASDISGQPDLMYPDEVCSVSAKYYDPDGRDDLEYCYLRLTHPEKPLTMMWNQATGEFWTYAGEEGENYLTVSGCATPISDTGYEITWNFSINDSWPEAENSIRFGVFAWDDGDLKSGWDYDDSNASFVVNTTPVVVTNPLAITALSDGFLYFGGQLWCFQGDTISAEFTVTNRGLELVTLDKLVVGGRDPNGEVVDFTTSDNIALEPGNSYDYQGQLVLPDKTGAYSFFCAYSTSEEGWNTCMDVELDGVLLEDPREADEFRTKRIEVLSTELLPSALPPPAMWEKVEGPWNEGDCTLSTLAVDPNSPDTLLAAVSYYDDYWGYVGDELHRSTDGGATWPLVGQGLPRIPLLPGSHLKKIEELAIAPSNPNIAYAGLSSGGVGVYRSVDGGITWAPTSGPFVEVYFGLSKRYPYVLSVAVDEDNPDVVYVGTEHYGVWNTTDGGEHWYEWGIPSAGPSEIYRNHVDVLEVVSTDPRVVYGSGYNYVPGMNLYYPLGIYQRVDSNGDGWCKKDPFIIDESYYLPLTPLVTDIAVAPDGQTIYFATNHNTVYLSKDGGASWENASGGVRNHLPESGNTQWGSTNLPCSLIMNPAFPNVIYASHAASGIWWSYSSGEDWFPAGLQDVGVAQTASDRDTNVLYAVGALNGSLYKLDISSNWVTVIRKHSPGELRVYDVQGSVTGMIDGQIVENIPNSGYDPSGDTVVIWSAVNPLMFEVVGTEDGSYGLTAGLVGIDDYINFNAVNIPTSTDATHQYSIDWDALAEGEEGVTVQVDSDGDGIFEQTITCDATLQPPMAEANGPYEGSEGSPIMLSASGSYDADGNITLHEWDFDGDGIYDTNSTSSNISHTWGDDYNGTVTLIVTDDDGLSNVDTAEVTVNNVLPTADAGPDQEALVYDILTLNGTATDPGINDTFTFEWDFGDGTNLTHVDLGPGSASDVATHTYNETGNYTVTLTVTDKDEGVGVDTIDVVIHGARWLKQDAVSKLQAVEPGKNIAQYFIDSSIRSVNNSLNDRLWVDDLHLCSTPMRGARVFSMEKASVFRLEVAQRIDPTIEGEVGEVIDKLTKADELLSITAIDDAKSLEVEDPWEREIVDWLIARAEEQLDKAYEYLDKDMPTRAITRFEWAWIYAQVAMEVG